MRFVGTALRLVLSVPLLDPFDFPVSACGRDACAVFVSSFSSLASLVSVRLRSSSVGGEAYRFPLFATLVHSSRPSSRRIVSWGVSCLFFAVRPSSRLAHQFAGVSLPRLVRRFVSRCSSCSSFIGALSRRFILPRLVAIYLVQSVSSSNPYSRFACRLVLAARMAFRAFRPSRSFSVLVSFQSLRLMAMMAAAARLSYLVAVCSPLVAPSWDPIGRWRGRNGRAARRYEGRAVFISSFSPSGKDAVGI